MNSKFAWSFSAFALLTLAGLLVAQNNAPATSPARIAVVDVSAVLNGLEEKVQIEADLQVEGQRLKDEEKARQEELRQLESDLKMLSPDNDGYAAKQQQFDQKRVELQAWSVYHTQRLSRDSASRVVALYKKLLETIKKSAQTSGYDLVLFKDQPLDRIAGLDNLKPEQAVELIQNRKVLFAADPFDITDQVRNLMNNEFAASH
ncbi:MAG: OmpH family outer membrane protein [Phycisphaeraceae bacterium]|nr:OmpH family outer membrane protein [Phycisphaeraceae bacterium]